MTVVKDVCDALKDMPDNILRDTRWVFNMAAR